MHSINVYYMNTTKIVMTNVLYNDPHVHYHSAKNTKCLIIVITCLLFFGAIPSLLHIVSPNKKLLTHKFMSSSIKWPTSHVNHLIKCCRYVLSTAILFSLQNSRPIRQLFDLHVDIICKSIMVAYETWLVVFRQNKGLFCIGSCET